MLSRARCFNNEVGQGTAVLMIAAAAGFGLLIAFVGSVHSAITTVYGIF